MKKLVILGSAAILSLMACTRNQEMETPAGPLSLYALTEKPAGSRTVVESGTHVYWEPGDEIAVFLGERSGKFVTALTSASASATFTGSLGEDAWPENLDLWAVYPYDGDATFDGESITTSIPEEQVARADSFGKDMNLSVAHSTDNTLQFYNVGGGIRFSLAEEGIRSVTLEGMDGNVLSGKVKVGFRDGVPVVLDVVEGMGSISIFPPENGTFVKDTWYYIVAIPGALEKGFKLHFQKADDYGFRVFDKAVTIKRSVYGTLTHADEGATYTTVTDENIAFKDNLVKSIVVEHFDTGGDGELSYREAAVVLSFLVDKAGTRADDGKVSIFAGTEITSFDELVYFTGLTRIEDGAFAGCGELASITIPENIAAIGDNAFDGCTSLESITLTSPTPPTIGDGAFDNTGDCPIIVPEDAVDGYVSAWPEYAERIQEQSCAVPEAVDLGLSVKWASFNLGASKPEEYGDYYAWGETEPKEVFSWENYQWCRGTEASINKYTAYTETNRYDLEEEDDPAHVLLGEDWRMPTKAERDELYANCTVTLETVGDVSVAKLTSKINGNSIYIPLAGYYCDSDLSSANYVATFWTASLSQGMFWAGSGFISCSSWGSSTTDASHSRCYGFPVRPVKGDLGVPVEGIGLDCYNLLLDVGETAQLTATVYPENASVKTVNWQSLVPDVATVSSTGAVTGVSAGSAAIMAVSADGSYRAFCTVTVLEPFSPATPEMVDLGLSVKWASFNLGATQPEEYGDYFTWGETEPYYRCLDPLIWKEGKENGYHWLSYKWSEGSMQKMSKYCLDPSAGYNGFTDGKIVLDPEDDAATVNLGGNWRMPTDAEWRELLSNCTSSWTTRNGVGGRLYTARNGNSIFLPAAGYRSGIYFYSEGTLGVYRSSSLNESDSYFAWQLGCNANGEERGCSGRAYGYPIRPVYGDVVPAVLVLLDKTELEIFVGDKASLTARVLPDNAHDKGILWSSSDEAVATVSFSGEVTAVAPGSATITVTTLDGGKTATCDVTVVTEPYTAATPELVDLGLSVKWSTFNLGATKPEESGDLFAWGETEPYYKSSDPSVWKPGKEEGYAWSSYRFNPSGDGVTFTKYTGEDYVTLQSEDDAATVNLGGNWRMPTVDEYLELRDRNNCDWTWLDNYEDSGVSGYLVTSKKEGYADRCIFLPAPGGWGDLWTASLKTDDGNGVYAYQGYFYSSASDWSGAYRCWGYPIRPVSD